MTTLNPQNVLHPDQIHSGYASAPQPLYSLPGDHRFHAGDDDSMDAFHEWQYFTLLGKDLDTGDDISFFWCIFQTAHDPRRGHSHNSVFLAYYNQNTGEFWSSANHLGGPLFSRGTSPDEPDFNFAYFMDDPVATWSAHYEHVNEMWRFAGSSTNDTLDGFTRNDPFVFDVTMQVRHPGYIPGAYCGPEGVGVTPGYRRNPDTAWGLTRYLTAPTSNMEGAIEIGGRTRRIEGIAFFEHHWGNCRDVETSRYFWGYMRLDDGRAFTWGQHCKRPESTDCDIGRTRFQLVNSDGPHQHAFGPTFVYTFTKWWTAALNGNTFPWWGEMETASGTLYFGPRWPFEEPLGLRHTSTRRIGGCSHIRIGSPDGPIVGTGFFEVADVPMGVSAPRVFKERGFRLNIDDMNR